MTKAAPGTSLVELVGVSQRYPGVRALNDVSFEVRPGEIVGLLGKNGAGKSTLIRILAGLESPVSGTVRIDGQPVAHTSRHAKSVGFHFVFQELEEFPELSVAENVLLGSRLPRVARYFLSGHKLQAVASKYLSEIGCGVAPGRRMSSLSTVERRLVMIARALAARTRLLVLDEPTASLTSTGVAEVLRVCREMRAAGAAVVYVSHRLEEVLGLVDRVVVMRDGSVVMNADREGLELESLVDAIAGRAGAVDRTRRLSRVARPAMDATAPARLRVSDLSDNNRFTGISFEVRDGEVLGIGGLIGAGRTEIVESIVGARPFTGGTVELAGVPVRFRSVHHAIRAGVVLLPEDRRGQGLIADYGTRENATLAGLRRFRLLPGFGLVSRARERKAVEPLVARLQMKIHDVDQPVRTLSGGTQQKVVTARALLTDSRVVIMDEPTVGIDVAAKEEIYELVGLLRNEGKAIILISSEFAELERLCDRVVVVAAGEQVGDLAGDEITEDEITRLCYRRRPAEAPAT